MDILLRYDEVITQKASKFSVDELRQNAWDTFAQIPQFVSCQSKVDEIFENVQAIHKTTLDKFDEVNKALTVEIFSAVKKAIK